MLWKGAVCVSWCDSYVMGPEQRQAAKKGRTKPRKDLAREKDTRLTNRSNQGEGTTQRTRGPCRPHGIHDNKVGFSTRRRKTKVKSGEGEATHIPARARRPLGSAAAR